MPKLFYSIKTPLGEFASSGQAAKAHRCDRTTIMKRIEADPDNYQKVPKPPAPPKPRYSAPRRTAWPLSWFQYRFLPYEEREAIYQAWCQKNQHDPDTETAADAFFDAMDLVAETEEAVDE